MPPVRVRALSVHAGYRCGNSGACCSSGWDIPVEPAVEEGLRAALRSGRLRLPVVGATGGVAGEPSAFRPVAGLPHGARVVFARDAGQRCVFLVRGSEGRPAAGGSAPATRCAVHAQLGEEALTSACRQFPRVVTLTPLGASVTLSHYCPTAAGMLFRHPEGGIATAFHPEGGSAAAPEAPAIPSLRILDDPPGFPPGWPYEGLDARQALPPFLRPGVLMSWPALERWEEHAVASLADESFPPEAALDALAAAAERARAWTPDHGDLDAFFVEALSSRGARVVAGDEGSAIPGPAGPSGPPGRGSLGMRAALGMTAWDLGARSVPAGHPLPPRPWPSIERAGPDRVAALVDDGWPALHRPIRAWLAAKAFASWLVLQGDGLRTAVLGLRAALGVLRAEAARGGADAGRALDPGLLKEAIRRADLLLVHLADPEALARDLSRCE